MNLHGNEKEFFRLMGLPLPVNELYLHYLEMMHQYDPAIKERVDEFNEYAKWVIDMGYSSCQNYRIDHAAKAFESWAKANDPLKDVKYDVNQFKEKDFRKANTYDLPVVQSESPFGNKVLSKEGHPLLSIDIAEANYGVMRLGAKQKGIQIPQKWSGFCDDVLRIHKFLATSKMFRQHCFGNYNSKTCRNVQRAVIQSLVDKFDLYDQAIYISSDEIVVPYDENSNKLHSDIYYHLQGSIYSGAIGIKTVLYEMYRLDGNDEGMLRVVYDGGNHEEKMRNLFAVPVSKHYMYYRKYILDQPLEENDTIFRHEGLKAKWLL